jgi:hypothetical protein
MATMVNTISAKPERGRREIKTRLLPPPAAAPRAPRTAHRPHAKLVYRILHAGAQGLLRGISVLTLVVPISYFLCALLLTGILRQDLFPGPVRNCMEAIVLPGKAVATRIFAVPMVFHGLDLVRVGWGLVALVLREIVLEPFRRLQTWCADKLEIRMDAPPRRRRASPLPVRQHSA